jgi:hypothetical protein
MQQLRVQDLFTARICAVVANVHRGRETDRLWAARDFAIIPDASPGPVPTTSTTPPPAPAAWDEKRQLEVILRMNNAFGGQDRRVH